MKTMVLVLMSVPCVACGDTTTIRADGRDVAAHDTSSVPDNGDAETVTPTPSEAFAALQGAWCEGYAERWCARAEACGCTAAPGFPAAGCNASFVAQCREKLSQYEGAVSSGEAVAHPEAIESCLTILSQLFDACALMPNDVFFVTCGILTPPGGFAAPGEGVACAEGGACALGLRCDTAGMCRVPGAAGAGCAGPTECEVTAECTDGKCAPPDRADAGKACAGNDECGGETACVASSIKACVARVAGGPCAIDEDCPVAQFCDTSTSICKDLPGDGAACANGASCAAGLGCGLDSGVCGALPKVGEPCALGTFGPLLCAAGTTCIDGVCGAIPGKDAPCAMGTPACADGLGCAFEPEGSFCREPADIGADCQNDPTCKDGLFCDFERGTCQPVRARGAPCSAGNECGDGVCLPDATFAFRCADRPGLGDACFIDECGPEHKCRSPYKNGVCVGRFCGNLAF